MEIYRRDKECGVLSVVMKFLAAVLLTHSDGVTLRILIIEEEMIERHMDCRP